MAPLTDAQRDLAASYYRMACGHAGRFAKRYPWLHEELLAAATLAVLRAAQSYEARNSSNASFGTFTWPRVRHRCLDVIWQAKKRRRPHTFTILEGDPGQSVEDRGFNAIDAIDSVHAMIRGLPPLHCAVMESIYCRDRSQRETAREMKCSQGLVSKLHTQSLAILRGEAVA